MILSFYNNEFKGLQNNASLRIENKSFKLVKRGVAFDEMSCSCEAYTENIQPTFVIIKDDRGRSVYGALAGIPELSKENITKIVTTDLKSIFDSDIVNIASPSSYTNVVTYLTAIFNSWNTNVNAGVKTELKFEENLSVNFDTIFKPATDVVVNVWQVFKSMMKYYGLYMTSKVDLVNKKLIFTIAKAMKGNVNIKLWEYGIRNYGKWTATINNTQAIVSVNGTITSGMSFYLTSDNKITNDSSLRDLYPVKKSIVLKETELNETDNITTKTNELLAEANYEALSKLTDYLFNEDITISRSDLTFDSACKIYINRGDLTPYKVMPVGELYYNADGVYQVKIGYRFTGLQFIVKK